MFACRVPGPTVFPRGDPPCWVKTTPSVCAFRRSVYVLSLEEEPRSGGKHTLRALTDQCDETFTFPIFLVPRRGAAQRRAAHDAAKTSPRPAETQVSVMTTTLCVRVVPRRGAAQRRSARDRSCPSLGKQRGNC